MIMIRTVIEINEEKCNGCGLCAKACHEGAIGMVNGKAKLLRDDYCDGLGDCLPACPTGAITFVKREAAAYDAAAVRQHLQQRGASGCPGSRPVRCKQLLRRLVVQKCRRSCASGRSRSSWRRCRLRILTAHIC